jgi:hypothetical protein
MVWARELRRREKLCCTENEKVRYREVEIPMYWKKRKVYWKKRNVY